MAIYTIAAATNHTPEPEPSIAHLEGFQDALTEPAHIVAGRIAWAWEHAAPEWADDYAAGALEVRLIRLNTAWTQGDHQ